MALKVKSTPKQLRTDLIKVVWPDDDAVDLEASDLIEWARSGGQSGLVIKPGMEPAVIKCRRLSEQAINHYINASLSGGFNAADIAFQFGCQSIPSLDWIRFGRPFRDIRGLDDDTMEALGEISMKLPYRVLIDELETAQGTERKEEVSEELQNMSLPKAIGCIILAQTFRK